MGIAVSCLQYLGHFGLRKRQWNSRNIWHFRVVLIAIFSISKDLMIIQHARKLRRIDRTYFCSSRSDRRTHLFFSACVAFQWEKHRQKMLSSVSHLPSSLSTASRENHNTPSLVPIERTDTLLRAKHPEPVAVDPPEIASKSRHAAFNALLCGRILLSAHHKGILRVLGS